MFDDLLTKATMDPALIKLKKLLQKLRQPQGCAWTRQQTFQSLAPQTLEECYEFIDAIEKNDMNAIKDELGDLLYHVIFYAQVAEEKKLFDLNDVANVSLKKHQERMPSDEQLQSFTAEQVSDYWDEMKAKHRNTKKSESILQDIPHALPAVLRAIKLQKRAADVGFDWPSPNFVFEKINEEIAEIKHELSQHAPPEKLLDEVGDLLFVCTNLARHLHIDPETALRHANEKFIKRFKFIEQKIKATGRALDESNLDEMEKFWKEAKQME